MRTNTQRLDRILFETSRAAEYFSVTELQAQTGQPVERFADVVLKELACRRRGPAARPGQRRRLAP
jgi:hypothetical protein